MRLLLILTLFSSSLSADINYVTKLPNTEKLHREQHELLIAISLTINTKTGKELTPHLDELMQHDKVKLTRLQKGHYGESGEGCIVKSGKYYYEGYFIKLNDNLSTAELASALIHELTHYKMLKEMITVGVNEPVKVSAFEISAFAAQYEFIKELEQLQLADHRSMFTDETQTVTNIMYSAYKLTTNWTDVAYDALLKQLMDFGYPYSELNRTISPLTEKECVGHVK